MDNMTNKPEWKNLMSPQIMNESVCPECRVDFDKLEKAFRSELQQQKKLLLQRIEEGISEMRIHIKSDHAEENWTGIDINYIRQQVLELLRKME